MNGVTGVSGARGHGALAQRLVAWALPWIVPAGAAGLAASGHGGVGGDASLFIWAGRTLVSAHWSHAFSSPTVQAGPLQLALFGSVGRSAEALAIVLATTTALLVVAASRAVGVENPVLLAGVGLLAVGTGFTRVGYSVGHPADAVLPLLWIVAAADARRGRTMRAGLLVGLSAGLETWGILGVAVLGLAPRWRQSSRGAAVAGAVAAALFLPFVVAGHFAMWRFQWHVRPPSPLSLLVADGTVFGWPLRLAQAALAVSAGVAVARLVHDSPLALWATPLAIVVTRLQFDPLLFSYYLTGAEGPVFVGATLLASRGLALRRRESYA